MRGCIPVIKDSHRAFDYLLAMRETRSIQSNGGEYASQQLQCSAIRRPWCHSSLALKPAWKRFKCMI